MEYANCTVRNKEPRLEGEIRSRHDRLERRLKLIHGEQPSPARATTINAPNPRAMEGLKETNPSVSRGWAMGAVCSATTGAAGVGYCIECRKPTDPRDFWPCDEHLRMASASLGRHGGS